jgi:hypothetical protein
MLRKSYHGACNIRVREHGRAVSAFPDCNSSVSRDAIIGSCQYIFGKQETASMMLGTPTVRETQYRELISRRPYGKERVFISPQTTLTEHMGGAR